MEIHLTDKCLGIHHPRCRFNASYNLPLDFNGVTASVVLNVRNLFDEVYVQDATDNSRYNAV